MRVGYRGLPRRRDGRRLDYRTARYCYYLAAVIAEASNLSVSGWAVGTYSDWARAIRARFGRPAAVDIHTVSRAVRILKDAQVIDVKWEIGKTYRKQYCLLDCRGKGASSYDQRSAALATLREDIPEWTFLRVLQTSDRERDGLLAVDVEDICEQMTALGHPLDRRGFNTLANELLRRGWLRRMTASVRGRTSTVLLFHITDKGKNELP